MSWIKPSCPEEMFFRILLTGMIIYFLVGIGVGSWAYMNKPGVLGACKEERAMMYGFFWPIAVPCELGFQQQK